MLSWNIIHAEQVPVVRFYKGNKFTHKSQRTSKVTLIGVMKKQKPSRVVLNGENFDFPLVKAVGYDHILDPIPLKKHRHHGYELTFIISGEVCWLLPESDEAMHLSGDVMAITQPETPHKGKWNIISPATFFWILLDLSLENITCNTVLNKRNIDSINTILGEAGNNSCRIGKDLGYLFAMLLPEMLKLKKNKKNHLAAATIRNLLSIIILKSAENFSGKVVIPERVQPGISSAIAFMKNNIAKDLSVAEMALSSGISITRFTENFKKEMGISPARYFSRLKCDKARELLTSTSYSITRISFSLGFSTTQYFANVFRKHMGMSPGKYRSATSK